MTQNTLTHKVKITVECSYQNCEVTLFGNGDLDHMVEAFKAALVAAGFSLKTAKKLDEAI